MSRYSQLYLERGRPIADSKRFRNRLAAWAVLGWNQFTRQQIASAAYLCLGTKMPGHGEEPIYDFQVELFFAEADVRDIFDTITIATEFMPEPTIEKAWLTHVSNVLREENLAYRLSANGIVHPFIDEQFDVNRVSALEALADVRFGEARDDFEKAFRHLRNGEGKQAIRMMFPAVEVAAKVLHPGALSRLMPNEIDKYILPKLRARYAGNTPALEAGQRLLEAFKDWIIASQPYRHGQEVQEPAEPPQDFVVAHLSAGATFLRWMIELAE